VKYLILIAAVLGTHAALVCAGRRISDWLKIAILFGVQVAAYILASEKFS